MGGKYVLVLIINNAQNIAFDVGDCMKLVRFMWEGGFELIAGSLIFNVYQLSKRNFFFLNYNKRLWNMFPFLKRLT
jgi:hypothetical protein